MSNKIETTFTEGLLQGYAGSEVIPIVRGSISGKSSHIQLDETRVYHDEWFVESHLGGGQELIEVEGIKYTRLYAGGTPESRDLELLGITNEDVGRYLVSKIIELGEQTRLFKECAPEKDGEWSYKYQIRDKFSEINLITAVETITYKDTIVHIHTFMLSPIN